MTEKLTFEADAALIHRLGRELVARQETALIELIKNGFDADATEMSVVFTQGAVGPALEIRDNGSGMDRLDLINGFLRLASGLKVQAPFSSKFGRQRAGRKGIGRFATQRLGDHLVLTTRSEHATQGLRLTVDWTAFTRGRDLSDVEVLLDEVDGCSTGTTIRIQQLYDDWSDAQIKRCWRGVLGLQQPFPVRPVTAALKSAKVDPGFAVRFFRRNELLSDEMAVVNLQTEILDHLHAVIELRVDDVGKAAWSISRNRFGSTRDWQEIHHEHLESGKPPPYKSLKNAWMKAHYVILDPSLLPNLVYTRLRDELASQGGIRLYRNGFRVVPYGDPDNDWLRLDEMYAKRSFLAPLANRNFFGIIEVHDPDGELYEEHTSREGLIENLAFSELKNLASSVLVTAATRISEDRGRKTKAGGPNRRKKQTSDAQEVLSQIGDAIDAAKEATERVASESTNSSALAAVAKVEEASRLLETKRIEVESAEQQMADEAAMLRFLATLGMTTAEFSHETGMTFEAFRLDFGRVFETVRSVAESDPVLMNQVERASGMLSRLDTLTSYLNALAAARSVRGIREVSLGKAVQEFERGIAAQAKAQNIELSTFTPPYDPLFTEPMHEAEVASILLNLYTNAVKAIKRSSQKRKISVVADRLQDTDRVRLRFYDSGDGISPEIRERIFDAFFTTSFSPPAGSKDSDHATGTGLGLWIVSQIVGNVGGEVFVGQTMGDYSTCIEVHLPSEKADES